MILKFILFQQTENGQAFAHESTRSQKKEDEYSDVYCHHSLDVWGVPNICQHLGAASIANRAHDATTQHAGTRRGRDRSTFRGKQETHCLGPRQKCM